MKAPDIREYTDSSSFANMPIDRWAIAALENVREHISEYGSNGIYSVASGGPNYYLHLGKLNNSYWAAVLQTYNDENIYFVRYSNGTCSVKVL